MENLLSLWKRLNECLISLKIVIVLIKTAIVLHILIYPTLQCYTYFCGAFYQLIAFI